MAQDDHLASLGRLALGLARTAGRAARDAVEVVLGPGEGADPGDGADAGDPLAQGAVLGEGADPSDPLAPAPGPPAGPAAPGAGSPGPSGANGGVPVEVPQPVPDAAIVANSHDAFVAVDEDGAISAWNRAAESTFGWTVEEALSRDVAEVLPALSPAAGAEPVERGRRTAASARHRDGRELQVEMTLADGEDEWSRYAFLHDISARVESERYRGAQLAVASVLAGAAGLEQAMPAALEAIGKAFGFEAGAFWRPSEQGTLRCQVFWSEASVAGAFERATRGLEVAPGEDLPGVALADRTATWVRKVAYDPDFSRSEAAREAGLESALASPLVRDDRVYGVIELLTSSGQPPKPEALDALAVISSQMAEFSARMVEQDAERLKDEFFALVSHELRTPLTSIIGYTDMLAKKEADGLSERGLKMLEVIRRNAGREMRLVGDLLMLVRIKAGRFELEPGTVGLRFVVGEAFEAARPAAERQGLELKLEAEEVARFPGDSERLGQVVDNLLSNAVKFTDEGSVEVRLFERGDRAVIEVSDSGPGIPPEDVERLFDRLYRASSATAGPVPGAGLGLTIVKGIVEAHGGSVEVESEVGSGTSFRVELPLTEAAGNLALAEPARNGESAAAANGGVAAAANGGVAAAANGGVAAAG